MLIRTGRKHCNRVNIIVHNIGQSYESIGFSVSKYRTIKAYH